MHYESKLDVQFAPPLNFESSISLESDGHGYYYSWHTNCLAYLVFVAGTELPLSGLGIGTQIFQRACGWGSVWTQPLPEQRD